MSFAEKIIGTTLASKIVALSGLALVTAIILAIPAANVYRYFYPPSGFSFPVPMVLFPVGLAFSIPFSFGLYGALGFWERWKVLAAFLVAPILALYLFLQFPGWLVIQVFLQQFLAAFLGVVLGLSLRYAYQKIKR